MNALVRTMRDMSAARALFIARLPHLVALALILIAGCTAMLDVKVEGLDGLITREHRLSQVDATLTCARFMGVLAAMAFLVMPLACARIYLQEWTCDIYYAEITAGVVLEHERLHWNGYWHDDRLREYRDAWRSDLERDL